MPTFCPKLPDKETLTRGLTSIFKGNGFAPGRLTALRRQPAIYSTSFPCEIVRCRFEDGSSLGLFCKYTDGDGEGGCSHGQRGGVGYEIEVYRKVLRPCRASSPTFYGAYTEPETGRMWLILEYLKRSRAVGKVVDVGAMRKAVRWIGRFHAVHEARLAKISMPFLTVYDAKYYGGWPRRTARFARHWQRRFPWLSALCKRLEQALAALAERPQTIIHGEYYPHNILYQRGVVRPVDWETAAIAAGEIDLATLIEGWPQGFLRKFEEDYQRARWPRGAPASFQRTLDLAQAYVQLRWLGDQQEWTNEKSSKRRFELLQSACKRLELL